MLRTIFSIQIFGSQPNTIALLIQWLLWVAFLQPILKCSIGIKPSGNVFFNLVCHWWQHTAHNNAKKYPNVINCLKSFVQFLFFLLIFYSVVVVFNFYDTLNELYFNDDLVILCVTDFEIFDTNFHTIHNTRQWNEMCYQWLIFLSI